MSPSTLSRHCGTALILVQLSLASNSALAADSIEPSSQDKREYLCSVSEINRDSMGNNLWMRAARGGKFQAVSSRKVRVASSSPEAAARELYGFYQVTAPQYQGIDRGKSAQQYVVQACTDDPASTRGVKVQALPLESYRVLKQDKEFVNLFFALNKEPIPDEQMVQIQDRLTRIPLDVFEKREMLQKRVAAIREQVKAVPTSAVAVTSGPTIRMQPYDFDKNQFDLGDITVVEYQYSYISDAKIASTQPTMPHFNLSDPGNLRFYRPSNQDEAKRIEQARSSRQVAIRTYIQPTKSWIDNGVPQINGVIAAIELLDKKEAVLARSIAR